MPYYCNLFLKKEKTLPRLPLEETEASIATDVENMAPPPMPCIARELRGPSSETDVATRIQLSAKTMVPFGRIADIYGRRRVFILGTSSDAEVSI